MRTVQTPFTRLTLYDDGVATAQSLRTDVPRSAELLSGSRDALAELVGDGARPLLWDPTGTLPLPPSGWQAIIEGMSGLVCALAIVVDDLDDHELGSFPAAIDSLLVPVRLFTNELDAREWLQKFVDPSLDTN